MKLERFERKRSLINFVKEENARFEAGEILGVSTNEELRMRFGYARVSSFYPILRQENLLQERKYLLLGKGRERLIPSRELAWVLGVVASGGNTNKYGAVSLSGKEEEFLQVFKDKTERLFQVNTIVRPLRMCADGKIYQSARFSNMDIARALGDLRRFCWPQTLMDRHSWIFSNNHYLWGLIEGIFETRGYISGHKAINFSSYYLNVANFIANVLSKAGIQSPYIKTSNTTREGVSGVGISNQRDMRFFAQNVYSVISQKESSLDFFRTSEVQTERKRRLPKTGRIKKIVLIKEVKPLKEVKHQFDIAKLTTIINLALSHGAFTVSQSQMLLEWLRLTESLGRTPSSCLIAKLKKEGNTPFAVDTYAYNFGGIEDGKRKFSRARVNIAYLLGVLENTGNIDELQLSSRARHWERVKSKTDLIEDYNIVREIALKTQRFPPTIHFIADLRKRGIVKYTANTLANYFGQGSFPKAREELERIIKERGAED